jgi:hypothetical protein
VRHVACKEAMRENLKGIDHFGDLGVNGRIILKLILINCKAWIAFSWLKIGSSGRLLMAIIRNHVVP